MLGPWPGLIPNPLALGLQLKESLAGTISISLRRWRAPGPLQGREGSVLAGR